MLIPVFKDVVSIDEAEQSKGDLSKPLNGVYVHIISGVTLLKSRRTPLGSIFLMNS